MRTPLDVHSSAGTFALELGAARSARDAAAVIQRWHSAFASAETPPLSAPRADRIGIWRPATIDGERWFVRDAAPDEARSWADVERIGPKRGRRIVLLGESCA